MTFAHWLALREQQTQVPETTRLLQLIVQAGTTGICLIVQAGTTGICRRDLAKAITLDRDVLDDLLAAMVAAGQIGVAEVGGETVYYPLM